MPFKLNISASARGLRPSWLRLMLLVFLPLCLTLSQASWNFELILQNANKRYGTLSMLTRDRINSWADLLSSSTNLSELEKLRVVNNFFNREYRFVDDISNWQQNDYWATPIEALVKGAGDCEDYAIAKYFSLRQLGIASDKLRITYVKALKYNQAHMVLTYYATPGAEPLVLDNLIESIKPASQRRDLLPVYAFNAEGLYLAGAPNKKGDSKKLSRWQDLLQKMRAEGFDVGDG